MKKISDEEADFLEMTMALDLKEKLKYLFDLHSKCKNKVCKGCWIMDQIASIAKDIVEDV